MKRLSRNFVEAEFACPCCGEVAMDMDFIYRLQRARSIAGIPFHINSGYRCPAHNAAVGGKSDSAHLVGHAAAVRAVTSMERYKVIAALLKAGFTRLGIGHNFVHVDDDPRKPGYVIWVY